MKQMPGVKKSYFAAAAIVWCRPDILFPLFCKGIDGFHIRPDISGDDFSCPSGELGEINIVLIPFFRGRNKGCQIGGFGFFALRLDSDFIQSVFPCEVSPCRMKNEKAVPSFPGKAP